MKKIVFMLAVIAAVLTSCGTTNGLTKAEQQAQIKWLTQSRPASTPLLWIG